MSNSGHLSTATLDLSQISPSVTELALKGSPKTNWIDTLSVSPDGKKFLFGGITSFLGTRTENTVSLNEVTGHRFATLGSINLSAVSSREDYFIIADNRKLYLVGFDGKYAEAHPISFNDFDDSFDIEWMSYEAVGDILYFAGNRQIGYVDFSKEIPYASPLKIKKWDEGMHIQGMSPAANGKVAFIVRNKSSIYVLEVFSNGQERLRLIKNNSMPSIDSSSITPDGNFLILNDGSNYLTFLRLNTEESFLTGKTFHIDDSLIDTEVRNLSINPEGNLLIVNTYGRTQTGLFNLSEILKQLFPEITKESGVKP